MQDKVIQINNKNIYYRCSGQGKVVVLIHGFCEDGNIWNEILPALQNEYQFIVPDLPGSGQSEMLEGDVSLEDYAEIIKAIIKEEKITGCTIIGHSMGGYITLAFAEKFPELLNAMGLFHSSTFADDDTKKQTRLKSIEFIKANGAYAYIKTSVPNLFAGKQHLPEIEALIESGKQFSAEALIQYLTAMMNRPDRTYLLKKTNKPVLFISGENDTAVPLQVSLQQCHLPVISFITILQNAGHMGMLEENKRCIHSIKNFLQKQ